MVIVWADCGTGGGGGGGREGGEGITLSVEAGNGGGGAGGDCDTLHSISDCGDVVATLVLSTQRLTMHLQNIKSLALPTCSLLSLAMQPRKPVVGGPSS